MKAIIRTFFALIFLHSASLSAQMPVAKVSPPFENPMHGDIIKTPTGFITVEPTGMKAQMFWTLKLDKIRFGIKVQSYDNAMKMTGETQLQNGGSEYGPFVPELEEINGKIFLISYKFTKGQSGDISVVLHELNSSSLAVEKEQPLFTIPMKNYWAFRTIDLLSTAELRLVHSADKKNTAALWYSGLNNEVFVSHLSNGVVSWEKKEMLRITDKVEVTSLAVNNSGNVFFTYRSSKGDPGNKVVAMDGKKKVDKDIKVKGGQPYESFVLVSANGEVLNLVGTYKGATDNLAGVFHQKLQPADLKVLAESNNDFSAELIQQLDKQDWASAKSKKYGINEVHMKAFALSGDDIALVGEFTSQNSYIRHNDFMGKNTIETRTSNSTGSVLVLQLLSDKLVTSVLPKMRTGPGALLGESFFAYPQNGKLYVFYNDYAKNLVPDMNAKFVTSNDHTILVLGVAEVTKDGSFKRAVVSDLTREDFLHLPNSATLVAPGAIQFDGIQLKLTMSGYVGKKSVVTVVNFK